MKHLIVSSLAAALMTTALSAPAFADPQGWDRDHNNGYYVGNRWHSGTPSTYMMRRHGYHAGWRDWRRGQRLPAYYRTHYVVVDDWRGHNLPPPRRGYHYVRDDTGKILLVAVATGLIASIIANSN